MHTLLILYSTTDGHTHKVCKFIYERLSKKNHQIALMDIEFADDVKLEHYDKILVAASIRYGKFNKKMREFVNSNADILNAKKTAFLSINLVARKPHKNSPDTNVYTRKYLKKTKWKPNLVIVVAGMLDYQKYDFFDRNVIRFIMFITGGPTDPKSVTEFTDWEKVEMFSEELGAL